MKVVEVKVVSIRDGEVVSATIIQEQKRNDYWTRVKAWDVMSGTPEASRRVLLEDDERLVIEGRASTHVVYDQEQKAAVVMPTDPAAAERKAQEDAKIAEANVKREEEARRGNETTAAQAAASAPRTNIGNSIVPTKPAASVASVRPTSSVASSSAVPGSAASKSVGGTPAGQGARASNEIPRKE